MNKRIVEIAEQNGFIHKWQPPGEQHEILQSLDKFAELIISECLDVVANADMAELEGPDPEDVLYVACKQVEKHFRDTK